MYLPVHVDRKHEEQPSSKKIKIVDSPPKDDLKKKRNEQKNTIKILKQKVRRQEVKMKSLSVLVEDLTKEMLISKNTAIMSNEAFSPVSR